MMHNEVLRSLLADFVEMHDLVREHGGKFGKKEILDYLPVAAAEGILFGTTNGARVVALAVIGPTNKPIGRDNFTEEGMLLFCYYLLVHPQYREPKIELAIKQELKSKAANRFPHCERFLYVHHDRFDGNEPEEEKWDSLEDPDGRRSATDASEPSLNSSDPTRDPSRASRSPPSSIASSPLPS